MSLNFSLSQVLSRIESGPAELVGIHTSSGSYLFWPDELELTESFIGGMTMHPSEDVVLNRSDILRISAVTLDVDVDEYGQAYYGAFEEVEAFVKNANYPDLFNQIRI